MDGLINGWMDRLINGWMDGWIDQWMDGLMIILFINLFVQFYKLKVISKAKN